MSKQSEHDEVTLPSYLDWVTSEDLRWRPSFGKYPLEWKDLLLIKGRNWVATRAESGYNIIDKPETLRRLHPLLLINNLDARGQ